MATQRKTPPEAKRVGDGLVNVAANLGTARDKAAYNQYVNRVFSYEELTAAYRSSWLPRAIVDIPAQESVRKWRFWQAEADQIGAIEKLEKQFRLKLLVKRALTISRLFGGAAIFINTGEPPHRPLVPERVRKIRSLNVLSCLQLRPEAIVHDLESEYFGQAEWYELMYKGEGSNEKVRIHASRLAIFRGAPAFDENESVTVPMWKFDLKRRQAYTGWGDSVLQSTMDAVQQADSAFTNINSLIFEAKVDVFKFEGLMKALSKGEDTAVINRMSAQALIKGINGAVVIDGQDDYQQKSASFGSLPELLEKYMQNVAGASRIPISRLAGRTAAGLSGSGDGDERVFFDFIQSIQSDEIDPALSLLDECLIWAALGSRPNEIYHTWAPLKQVNEKERAEIFKMTADAARQLAGSQAGELIPVEALSDALVNELVEQGVLPGLEQQIDEYGSLAEQMEEEEKDKINNPPPVPPVVIPEPTNQPVGDAEPRTLYVRRDVLNAEEVIRWAKAVGFETTLPADDMHVTIAYSRTPVDWMKIGEAWGSKLELPEGGPRLMETFGEGAQVLLFKSSELEWRHESIRNSGASWDHPEYQPHITISYGPMPEGVTPYQGKIVLGPEIFEEVKEDWKAGIKEE